MSSSFPILTDRSLVIIFAYAPAGLGHLRVTKALYDGLPKEVTPILLGTQDKSITIIHRLMSTHTILKNAMEWIQNGPLEGSFTDIYKSFLRKKSEKLESQLLTILDERIDVPSKILIVATHFGLAHAIASIKDEIANKRHVAIKLVVVVTDDSPQKIWYVPQSDLTFVPSSYTKNELIQYGEDSGLSPLSFVVCPYPISPHLSKLLPEDLQHLRMKELNPSENCSLEIAIPISGVAVGTGVIKTLIDEIKNKINNAVFHVIAKTSPFTGGFLEDLMDREYVTIYTALHDRQIVNTYEEVYKNNVISLEITKPSEQAFKALLCSTDVGGSVLLFLNPVGRQEYDNLNFLKKHRLIPTDSDHEMLYEKAGKNEKLDSIQKKELEKKSRLWRGIRLPEHPLEAANLIRYLYNNKILFYMADVTNPCSYYHTSKNEMGSNGVERFWQMVTELI